MNRNNIFLAILFILQLSTSILTAYAINYLSAVELDPISALFIGFLYFPLNYITGFLVSIIAYIAGYWLVSYVDEKYRTKVTRYYFLVLIIVKVIDFLNDFIYVLVFHFH